jgi:hypothetical protein
MAGTMGTFKLYMSWPIILEIKYPMHVSYFPISWLTYVYMFVCVCVRACVRASERARVGVYGFACISFCLCT